MNKFAIERLEGRGLTAVVKNTGSQYTTYDTFAKASGYPDAVAHTFDNSEWKKSRNGELLDGKIVDILAKGKHGDSDAVLYIVQSDDGERFLFGEKGLEINENKTEVIGMVKSLKEIVSSLRACDYTCEAGPLENNVDFQLLSQIAGADVHAQTFHTGEAVFPIGLLAKSPQQQRDYIIEQAKRDVAELHDSGLVRFNFGVRRLEFVVNQEKRTVVALLRGYINENVRERGIAKCAPNDCFNAHIGRAISLRRALGLEVPAEYLNATQPTEVRVGDVVEFVNLPHKVGETRVIKALENSGNDCRFTNGNWVSKEYVKVIDDTRADAKHGVSA